MTHTGRPEDDVDFREEIDSLEQALRPDPYNIGLTIFVILGSSFSMFQYLWEGAEGFHGSGGAGFPYHFWVAWETQDPNSTIQATQFDPLFLVVDIVIVYVLMSLLFYVAREGFEWF